MQGWLALHLEARGTVNKSFDMGRFLTMFLHKFLNGLITFGQVSINISKSLKMCCWNIALSRGLAHAPQIMQLHKMSALW
jgi:hypothetical protein